MFDNKQDFKNIFRDKMLTLQGKNIEQATSLDVYKVLGAMIREKVMGDWAATAALYREQGNKQAYYFSMEFLLGRLLESNLLNMGLLELCREGWPSWALTWRDRREEPDAGLGNGGLGRLAACFLDSLASLICRATVLGSAINMACLNSIREGYQIELPDSWLKEGNIWEIRRPEEAVEVHFGGQVRTEHTGGRMLLNHEGFEGVQAVPYDMPVVGYHNKVVNTLRLWSAEALGSERCLNAGCFQQAVDYQHTLESISGFLYPDDSSEEGKRLRLKQQYFGIRRFAKYFAEL